MESSLIYNQDEVVRPLLEEVVEGINKLKDNKASSSDANLTELLKNGGTEVTKKLYGLMFGTVNSKIRTMHSRSRALWSTDVDEGCLQELADEDQYATTQELVKELDISAMSISCTMHCINLMYKFIHGCRMS
ncbi:hypothetical protein X975_02757, partial [Stegodyphus mimosarum]